MRRVLFLSLLSFSFLACSDVKTEVVDDFFPEDWIGGTCGALFGLPTSNTGLSSEYCQPSCNCDGMDFVEPEYTQEDFDWLKSRTLLTVPEELTYDPYEDKDQYSDAPTTEVCAFIDDEEDPNGYHIQTYRDDAEAAAAGAQVTHYGPCGLCSSFEDLVVYLSKPDLTNPVRQCGFEGLRAPAEEREAVTRACLEEIGFSEPCANIWYYNVSHTRTVCMADCIMLLNAPLHTPDGQLNACIQCDEDRSGPVFKTVAGRTRRNSGLATALCRPCDEVSPIDHRYGNVAPE